MTPGFATQTFRGTTPTWETRVHGRCTSRGTSRTSQAWRPLHPARLLQLLRRKGSMETPLVSTLFGASSHPRRSPWTHVVVWTADQLTAKVGRCACHTELREAEDEQHARSSQARGLQPERAGRQGCWSRRPRSGSECGSAVDCLYDFEEVPQPCLTGFL